MLHINGKNKNTNFSNSGFYSEGRVMCYKEAVFVKAHRHLPFPAAFGEIAFQLFLFFQVLTRFLRGTFISNKVFYAL